MKITMTETEKGFIVEFSDCTEDDKIHMVDATFFGILTVTEKEQNTTVEQHRITKPFMKMNEFFKSEDA